MLVLAENGGESHVITCISTFHLGVRVDVMSTRPATDADRANRANLATYRPATGKFTESA
jgi:hypothetical protein